MEKYKYAKCDNKTIALDLIAVVITIIIITTFPASTKLLVLSFLVLLALDILKLVHLTLLLAHFSNGLFIHGGVFKELKDKKLGLTGMGLLGGITTARSKAMIVTLEQVPVKVERPAQRQSLGLGKGLEAPLRVWESLKKRHNNRAVGLGVNHRFGSSKKLGHELLVLKNITRLVLDAIANMGEVEQYHNVLGWKRIGCVCAITVK